MKLFFALVMVLLLASIVIGQQTRSCAWKCTPVGTCDKIGYQKQTCVSSCAPRNPLTPKPSNLLKCRTSGIIEIPKSFVGSYYLDASAGKVQQLVSVELPIFRVASLTDAKGLSPDVEIKYHPTYEREQNTGVEIGVPMYVDSPYKVRYLQNVKITSLYGKPFEKMTAFDCDNLWTDPNTVFTEGVGIGLRMSDVACVLTREGQITKIRVKESTKNTAKVEWEYLDTKQPFKCNEKARTITLSRGSKLLVEWSDECDSYAPKLFRDMYCAENIAHVKRITCTNACKDRRCT